MLYLFCFLQILVYLFLIPLARLATDDVAVEYAWGIGASFLLAFLLGGWLRRRRGAQSSSSEYQMHALWMWLPMAWAAIFVSISAHYQLFNRRIGTHAAGELFASIPFYELAVLRSFEILLPFLLSMLVVRVYRHGQMSYLDKATSLMLVLAIGLSGAMNSRSQIAFLMMSIIVVIQNNINRLTLKRFIFYSVLLALAFIVGVSAYRALSIDAGVDEEYLRSEFLARLDGLEIISRLTAEGDLSWFGVNQAALLPPLISSVPFLPEAVELKAAAMTSVKANILYNEFWSPLGDINSFVILDVYYWGGVCGLIVAGVVLGYVARWADSRVGRGATKGSTALSIAVATNLVFMEREFISMLINIFRDWTVLYLFLLMFFRKKFSIGSNSGGEHADLPR